MRAVIGSLFLFLAVFVNAPALAEDAGHLIEQAGCEVLVLDSGIIQSFVDPAGHQLVLQDRPADRLRVRLADRPVAEAVAPEPVRVRHSHEATKIEYELSDPPLSLRYEISVKRAGGSPVLVRNVVVIPNGPVKQDFIITLPNAFAASAAPANVFIPQWDGRGAEKQLPWSGSSSPSQPAAEEWLWPLDTEVPKDMPDGRHLALPMISAVWAEPAVRLTYVADPFASVTFKAGAEPCVEWRYPASKVPLTGSVTRNFWTVVHSGSPEAAMQAWYATALGSVPPGPAWLHDVAWQHYDYLSFGGRGWFEDIDAAEKMVPKEDRGKVIFTLHGWYDLLGRYCFDEKTGQLDNEWAAFPSAAATKKNFPTSESVKLTKAEMHRRMRYAKDRGFRVCLYFADGLAACEGAWKSSGGVPTDQILHWGGWQGPDTIGKSYCQNPAHRDVAARYCDYLSALLTEYGKDLDALVWDETFMVRAGAVAPKEAPAPALVAPAMMRLTRELTQITTEYSKEIAFLTSDCLGVTWDDKTRWVDVPPYAIMSHGCYQDSHSRPNVWPYAIFANYRNVMWSCNWNAVTRFDYTRFGVEHYSTPVATSNGWLDCKGIAGLNAEQRDAVLQLFNSRKDTPQRLKWLTGPAPQFAPGK